MKSTCKCCGEQSELKAVYEGSIRHGKFNSYRENQRVVLCELCSTRFIDDTHIINYDNEEYRSLVQEYADEEYYYREHDKEQSYNIEVLNTEVIRGKKIADIGCGAGSFLDNIRGVTSDVIAVEPYSDYQNVLRAKGYNTYSYVNEIEDDIKFDIATSFAVIEHVDDPIQFLSEIKRVVKKGGIIIVSTPNSNDFQLDLIGREYESFYYRTVHPFYFNESSFKYISKRLEFSKVEFFYKHKYDLSNLFYWLKDKKPTGLGKNKVLDELDVQYKYILEKNKVSNFLYVKFTV